jgi:hypothetical protein
MDQAEEEGEGQQSLLSGPMTMSATFEGDAGIPAARELARSFLGDVQAVHGLPVSARAMGMVQLVVSELVTNAYKYAPGPCLVTLELSGGAVQATGWDSEPTLPVDSTATRVAAPSLDFRSPPPSSSTHSTSIEHIQVHRPPRQERVGLRQLQCDRTEVRLNEMAFGPGRGRTMVL